MMSQNAYLLNMFAAGFGGLMGFAIVILITTLGIFGFGFLMLRLRANVVGVMNDAAESVINNFVMPKTSASMSAAMSAGDTSVNSAVNGAMGAAGQAGKDGMAGGTGMSTATIAAGGAAAGGGSRMLSGNPSGSIAGYDSHVSFATGSGSAGDVSVTGEGAMGADASAFSMGRDAGVMEQTSSDKKGTFVAGREVGTSIHDAKEKMSKATETLTGKKDSSGKEAAMPAGVATGVATATSEMAKATMAEKSDKEVATAALKADSLAAFAQSASVGTSPGIRALNASHFGPMSGNLYSEGANVTAEGGMMSANAYAQGAQAGDVRAVRADAAGGLQVTSAGAAGAAGSAGAAGAGGAAAGANGSAGTAGQGGEAGRASAATDVRSVAGMNGSSANVSQGAASSYVNARGGSAGRAGANGGRGSAAAGTAGKNGAAGAGGSAGVGEGAEAANVRAVAVGSNVAVHPSATAMAGAPGAAGAGGSAGAAGAAAMQQNGQMYRQSAMQRGQVDANGRPVNGQVTGKVSADGKLQADGENRRVSQVNQVNRSSSVTDRMMAGTPSGASGSYGRQSTNISTSQYAQQMQQQGSYRNSAMQAGGTERGKMAPGQGATPASQAQYMNSTQVRAARQVGGQQMSTQGNNGGGQYGKVDATLHDAPAGTYPGSTMNVRNTVANNYQQGAPVAAGGDGVPGSGGGSFGNPRSGGAQYASAGYRGSQAGGRYSKDSRYTSSSEMRGYMSSRQGGGVVSPSLRNAPNSGGRNATQAQYAMQRDRNRTQNPNAGRSSADGYGAASGPMPAKGLDVGGNMVASSGQSGDWITAPAEPTGSFANKSGRKRPTHKDNTAYV